MKEKKEKRNKKFDKGEVFVKVMAGILAILMVSGTGIAFIYALIG